MQLPEQVAKHVLSHEYAQPKSHPDGITAASEITGKHVAPKTPKIGSSLAGARLKKSRLDCNSEPFFFSMKPFSGAYRLTGFGLIGL